MKLRRFASVSEINTGSQEKKMKKESVCCKSVNVPPEDQPMESATLLSQARPLDSEAEEQMNKKSSVTATAPEEISASCEIKTKEVSPLMLRRKSWSSSQQCGKSQQLTNASPTLQNLRLSMFFEKQQHEEADECQRSLSVSSSFSSESADFNGSKATVIYQNLSSRPQSGDT